MNSLITYDNKICFYNIINGNDRKLFNVNIFTNKTNSNWHYSHFNFKQNNKIYPILSSQNTKFKTVTFKQYMIKKVLKIFL